MDVVTIIGKIIELIIAAVPSLLLIWRLQISINDRFQAAEQVRKQTDAKTIQIATQKEEENVRLRLENERIRDSSQGESFRQLLSLLADFPRAVDNSTAVMSQLPTIIKDALDPTFATIASMVAHVPENSDRIGQSINKNIDHMHSDVERLPDDIWAHPTAGDISKRLRQVETRVASLEGLSGYVDNSVVKLTELVKADLQSMEAHIAESETKIMEALTEQLRSETAKRTQAEKERDAARDVARREKARADKLEEEKASLAALIEHLSRDGKASALTIRLNEKRVTGEAPTGDA